MLDDPWIYSSLIIIVLVLVSGYWLVSKWANVQHQNGPRADQVDVNEKCPVCGHRQGKVECVNTPTRVYLEHTCLVCKASWNVNPIAFPDGMPTGERCVLLPSRQQKGATFE